MSVCQNAFKHWSKRIKPFVCNTLFQGRIVSLRSFKSVAISVEDARMLDNVHSQGGSALLMKESIFRLWESQSGVQSQVKIECFFFSSRLVFFFLFSLFSHPFAPFQFHFLLHLHVFLLTSVHLIHVLPSTNSVFEIVINNISNGEPRSQRFE
jgi:hypothetical protein